MPPKGTPPPRQFSRYVEKGGVEHPRPIHAKGILERYGTDLGHEYASRSAISTHRNNIGCFCDEVRPPPGWKLQDDDAIAAPIHAGKCPVHPWRWAKIRLMWQGWSGKGRKHR